jgi:hypothetical protein
VVLSADGTTAVVGARTDEDPNGPESGSAYVFKRQASDWSQEAKLVAWDGDSQDQFGRSLGVSSGGRTALVGAVRDEHPHGESAGTAYVFSV